MTHKIIATDEQMRLINAAINESEMYIQVIARRVGAMKGAEKDQALPEFVRIAAQLPEMTYTRYESMLARAVGLTTMELRKQVKVARKQGEKDEETGENVRFTLGGNIKGYIVEYLYDPDTDKSSLAWRDPDGNVGTGSSVVIDGEKYIPKPPDAVIRMGAILYPSKLGEKKDTATLAAMNLSFIRRNFLFHDSLVPKIMSYWVFLSWTYDCFPAVPYLRANGEPGSGKSEMMYRLSLICNKRFVVSGASSTSSLFRIMQTYNFPTLVMDEMDQSKSDAATDIAKLLNQGAMRDGAPITKSTEVTTDGEKRYEPEVYRVYCPKLISMQGTFFDKAIESRCITFQVQPSDPIELRAAKMPLYMTEDMKQEALAMRNLLVRWRLENWGLRDMKDEYFNVNISSRLNQVTWPIQALAEGEENSLLRKEINDFMEDYFRWMTQDKNMTVEARIIEAMWTIYKYPDTHQEMVETDKDGRETIKIGFITKIANSIIAQMNMEDDSDDDDKKRRDLLSPQKVGHRLREKLQIETSARSKDGYSAYWENDHMTALAKRYGVEVENLEKIEAQKSQINIEQKKNGVEKQGYLPGGSADR